MPKAFKWTTIPFHDNELWAQNLTLALCKTVQKLGSFKETMMSVSIATIAIDGRNSQGGSCCVEPIGVLHLTWQ